MYAETDFFLAVVKGDDWLGDRAETVLAAQGETLWTSQFTLVELLVVAYRENLDTERVVANAASLVRVVGDVETVLAAATYVKEHDFTPFDALHLVDSSGDVIVSSDDADDGFAPRLPLVEVEDS